MQEAEGYLDLITVFGDQMPCRPDARDQLARRVLKTLDRIDHAGGLKAHVLFLRGQALMGLTMGAITAGAHMVYLLGPGVHMALRGGLMFGPRFSGGGTISPLGALRLGLGLNVAALRGRLRFNGDYDFQRVSRKTNDGSGELPAPIQQSLGRVGIAVAF